MKCKTCGETIPAWGLHICASNIIDIYDVYGSQSQILHIKEKEMTREEAIEYLKQDITGDLDARVNISKRVLKKILDAFKDEPHNDIPIGAPCQVVGVVQKLQYYNGEGKTVDYAPDINGEGTGNAFSSVRPLTIWDIPEQYGGPPKWAIARAYSEHESIWCRDNSDIDFLIGRGYTIERRPKEK